MPVVLVIEDTDDDEALLVRALKRTGLKTRIVVAHDGAEALHYLFGAAGDPDADRLRGLRLVISDVKLPKVDGLTVLQRIRSEPTTWMIPVVLFSSSVQDDDLRRAYCLGANSYIRKPVLAEEFVAAASQLGSYWLSFNEPPPASTAHAAPPQRITSSVERLRRPSELRGEDTRELQLFRLAVEASPTGMILIDRQGRIILVNSHTEKLFGYYRNELLGEQVEILVPERFRRSHTEARAGFFASPAPRAMGKGGDLFGRHKNGSEVPIEIGLTPLSTSEGDFVLSSISDISERKRGEAVRVGLVDELCVLNAELEERVRSRTAELTASLRERDVLLKEVHHRVKNNLQVISSLINMQMRRVEHGKNRDALEECQMRVQAIALIHERLYQSMDYSRVAFSEYVRSLASNVFHATGVSPGGVRLELAIDDVALPVDKAIPCGLLLNELITNSLKHAFKDRRLGSIRVEFSKLETGQVRLAVKDDGVGLPEGLDMQRSESLGLRLVSTLAKQLEAELDVNGSDGASFVLTFQAERR